MQKSTNQNYNQHQQPICSSTLFSTSTIKAVQLQRLIYKSTFENMPKSTAKENHHQQKFLFSSTTMRLKINVVHRHQQKEKHVFFFTDLEQLVKHRLLRRNSSGKVSKCCSTFSKYASFTFICHVVRNCTQSPANVLRLYSSQ